MSFDNLLDGVGPDDCEPNLYEPLKDPDRFYEMKIERDHDEREGEI